MRRLPPSAGESGGGERPTANHDGVGSVTEGEGGQAHHGANHPGKMAPGLDRALADRRQGAARHEGAAHANQAEKNTQKFNGEHFFNMLQEGGGAQGVIYSQERNSKLI